MLETKEQKRYFALSMVVVLVLAVITVAQRPNFQYQDTTDYAKLRQQSAAEQKAYADYLASIKTDPQASQQLFQTILTENDVRQAVEAELKTDQPVNPPVVADSALRLTNASGKAAITDYLTAAIGPLVSFNQKASAQNQQIFADPTVAANVTKLYTQAFRQLTDAPVPKEAVNIQKALVSAYMSYGKLLDLSQQYASQQNTDPWADVYQQYAAIDQSAKTFTDGYNQLVGKYQLADASLTFPGGEVAPKPSGFTLIPKAQAFLGLGDVTITAGDIPRLIMDAVEQGLVSSFSTFMSSFLDKMVQKIESNYMIANFLYYSDALVNGQYADDYLNKYVSDSLDRQIIKQFIPQFSCDAQNQTLAPLFQAKASQYLGFDPVSLSPTDPNYYQRLASVGDFLSSPSGWQLYYQDMADQTESAAQQAVNRELTSSGLKSPRNALTGSITTSINSIVSGERASLQAMLQLGISNASSFASAFIAQITQTLFTKFVFSGATTNSPRNPSAVGVLKEQATCLAAAQLTPVVPIYGTQYQPPPPPPSSQQELNQVCSQLPQGCTTTPAVVSP